MTTAATSTRRTEIRSEVGSSGWSGRCWLAGGAAFALWAGGLEGAELRVVGSDLLGDEFVAELKGFAQQREMALAASLRGSRAALRALEQGEADVGIVMTPERRTVFAKGLRAVPLAYHVTHVVAPRDLPRSELTLAELAAVFGAKDAARLGQWGGLGLGREWANRRIVVLASDDERGLSLGLFRHVVLGDGAWRGDLQRLGSPAAVLQRLAVAEGGVALVAAPPPETANVKVLAIARGEGGLAFEPSPENVHAGDYPLSVPLWLVVREEAVAGQLEFLRHLLGEETAARLRRTGLIAVPEAARQRLALDLEAP